MTTPSEKTALSAEKTKALAHIAAPRMRAGQLIGAGLGAGLGAYSAHQKNKKSGRHDSSIALRALAGGGAGALGGGTIGYLSIFPKVLQAVKSEAKVAASRDDVINRYARLALSKIKKHQVIGGRIGGVGGAVLGGGLGSLVTRRQQPGESKQEHSTRKAENMVRGAVVGGLLGHGAGGEFAGRRSLKKSLGNIDRYKKDVSDYGSRRTSNFWKRVPEEVRNKAYGVARMSKGTGHEATNAQRRLADLSKKHNFDAQRAVKVSSFHLALLAGR